MRTTLLTLLAAVILSTASAADADAVREEHAQTGKSVPPDWAAFSKSHCLRCHNAAKRSGDFRVDDLTDPGDQAERWTAVRDQLRDGLMPPPKEPRPDANRVRALTAWISSRLGVAAPRLPNQGNLVPHELLFGKPAEPTPGSAPRVWRLSPEAYLGFLRSVHRGRLDQAGAVQPFSLEGERGIRDFAELYAIDEPGTEILVRNAAAIVDAQSAHTIKDGRLQGRNDTVREFVELMNPVVEPTRKQLETAVQTQYRMAIGRRAEADEVERLLGLYDNCAAAGDRPGAVKTMLQAVLLKADAMYRSELGAGAGERRMLAPAELALALSLALGHQREAGVAQAAAKGELTTREQVAAHVKRMLDDPKFAKPRLLGFFREYFEYHKAVDVFKEKPVAFKHAPATLVADTDRLVLHVLAQDQDVLRRLLTTRETFVNFSVRQNKQTRRDEPQPAVQPDRPDKNGRGGAAAPEHVYGFAEWPAVQPATFPEEGRIGILMQPSWLAAWSTNFENDPVRRGRWVRERLLGGTVPDLPIGVAAQVPDEPHRTYRDRLTVTRADGCWKCHRHMDELGLPFEQFDHYGRFRRVEPVLDREATARNVDKKGAPLGRVLRDAELVTTGTIAGTGDATLDGPVRDPRELLTRIAGSDRARQVFIRHAFRYFMGRNESPTDAAVLQAADRAYRESGGSFKALVTSLLTSDAFLYRTTATRTGDRK